MEQCEPTVESTLKVLKSAQQHSWLSRKENVCVYPIKTPGINKHFRHNLIMQLEFGQDFRS